MPVLTPFDDRGVHGRTPVTPVALALPGPDGRLAPVVRDWRLDKKLGTGSTAYVYAATNVRDGRRAALKILRAHVDESTQRRFLREGYVANAVGHPGVVQIFDQGVTDGGELFIVMELLDGESLDALRARLGGSLPVRQVVDMGCELLDILAAAHARRVIHRDLKPANIFVGTDGKLKVLDFGLAYIAEPARSSSITGTGVIMGTPAFMPPEQARGRRDDVDARSDIWALGATLFALLAGRAVHVAASHPGQMLAILTRPATPLLGVAPHVPRAVAAVVDRALAFERENRWQDAESMGEALRWTRLSMDGNASPQANAKAGAGSIKPRGAKVEFDSTPVKAVPSVEVVHDGGDPSDELTRVAAYALSTAPPPPMSSSASPLADASSGEYEGEHTVVQSVFAAAPETGDDPALQNPLREPTPVLAPVAPPAAPFFTPAPAAPAVRARPGRASGILGGTAVAGIVSGVIAGALALGLIVATERYHRKPAPVTTSVTAAAPLTTAADAPSPAPLDDPPVASAAALEPAAAPDPAPPDPAATTTTTTTTAAITKPPAATPDPTTTAKKPAPAAPPTAPSYATAAPTTSAIPIAATTPTTIPTTTTYATPATAPTTTAYAPAPASPTTTASPKPTASSKPSADDLPTTAPAGSGSGYPREL